jgi:hypothetical protein
MVQQLFNPGPSSLRTARMLNYRTPKVTSSFPSKASPAPSLHLGRIGRADGGGIPDSPAQPFTGPIMSTGAGRTDNVPMHVPSGAYVIPADVVSHMGEGNSMAGLKMLNLMYNPQPYNAQGGPYGAPMGKAKMGKGAAMPHAAPPSLRQPTALAPTPAGPAPMDPRQARGGQVPGDADATPIAASGGEFVISPAEVKRLGEGDLGKGHRLLDAFVMALRKDHIKTLQKLPGPAQD